MIFLLQLHSYFFFVRKCSRISDHQWSYWHNNTICNIKRWSNHGTTIRRQCNKPRSRNYWKRRRSFRHHWSRKTSCWFKCNKICINNVTSLQLFFIQVAHSLKAVIPPAGLTIKPRSPFVLRSMHHYL